MHVEWRQMDPGRAFHLERLRDRQRSEFRHDQRCSRRRRNALSGRAILLLSTQLMALSNDWTALSAKIDAMQPVGNTNQAIGLQMGWQSLTEAPFTIPAQDPDYKYMQVIILLTDGLNTEDRWYTSQNSIDNREQKTCTNVKAAGITVYTVQVNTGGDPTSNLLQSCASNSTKFFLLTSADQIVSTFQQIGTALSQLHLSM